MVRKCKKALQTHREEISLRVWILGESMYRAETIVWNLYFYLEDPSVFILVHAGHFILCFLQ